MLIKTPQPNAPLRAKLFDHLKANLQSLSKLAYGKYIFYTLTERGYLTQQEIDDSLEGDVTPRNRLAAGAGRGDGTPRGGGNLTPRGTPRSGGAKGSLGDHGQKGGGSFHPAGFVDARVQSNQSYDSNGGAYGYGFGVEGDG